MPATSATDSSSTAPVVRSVSLLQPFSWLLRGGRDLMRNPGASLFYGMAMAAAGTIILLAVASLPHLFTAAISGFLLVAPMLATGLYDLSRRIENGEPVRLVDSMQAWRANPSGLVGFGLFGLLAGTAWQVMSLLIVAMLYKGNAMAPLQLVIEVLRDPRHMQLFMAYIGIGGILAAMVFALSVVSVPMLLDRKCELLPAMQASIGAVSENPLPLAIWATIIMLLVALGFATFLLGFIVIMPLLGHASWHAYRDLIER
ncbi:MAG: DUF2189 domain-containing protein [Gammaproteobacteria bacterium]|nr:DUF2189 domain-containing protein [Gammaproteobacteria bacterium]MBU1644839.1 DUF2189 domain-containing protein [Gammaproteobacteria bacterium]MBU1973072.1 DUF2189 domain-containing protein [Gammaproteobacteria bacterium]